MIAESLLTGELTRELISHIRISSDGEGRSNDFRSASPVSPNQIGKSASRKITGIRSWICAIRSLASVVMIEQERSHSCVSGSRQASQTPAKQNGVSFLSGLGNGTLECRGFRHP